MNNDKMVSVPFKALRDFLEHSACTYKGPEWTNNKAALRHAMSAQVERDWEPLTSAGQVQLGDWMSFRVAGSHICAKATLIIDPGTGHEEIVYNVKKNHYFITSMAIDGTSTHKGVLVSKSIQEPAQ